MKADPWSGYMSPLARAGNMPVRQRVLPGETQQQARRRWGREERLEEDRLMAGRLPCGGQVERMPHDD